MGIVRFLAIMIALMAWLSWAAVISRDSIPGRQAFVSSSVFNPILAPPLIGIEDVDRGYQLVPSYMVEGSFNMTVYSPPCIYTRVSIVRLGDGSVIDEFIIEGGDKPVLTSYAPTPGVYGVVFESRIVDHDCLVKVHGNMVLFQARVPEERLRTALLAIAIASSVLVAYYMLGDVLAGKKSD